MELKNIEAGVLNIVYEEWGPAVGELWVDTISVP